ncbi:lipopolysaccharide core heptosyltransferase RfaQ, partial [Escherichia coli]|nr:lipopolysaccharide core heptosyltransferase RfaQ [Escherichia coli]
MVALLVRCLPARMKISQLYGHRQHGIWKKSFTHLAPIHGTHIVERNLSVLEPLGITDFYTETTMSYAEDCWKKMRQELDALG